MDHVPITAGARWYRLERMRSRARLQSSRTRSGGTRLPHRREACLYLRRKPWPFVPLRPELSAGGRCLSQPEDRVPTRHALRTPFSRWYENQGLSPIVRDVRPDPSRNYEQFVQIETGGVNTGENDGVKAVAAARSWNRQRGRCRGRLLRIDEAPLSPSFRRGAGPSERR